MRLFSSCICILPKSDVALRHFQETSNWSYPLTYLFSILAADYVSPSPKRNVPVSYVIDRSFWFLVQNIPGEIDVNKSQHQARCCPNVAGGIVYWDISQRLVQPQWRFS